MKKFLIILSTLLVFLSIFFGKNITSAMAQEPSQPPMHTYYTSIVIQDGETLWEIAERYGEGAGKDTASYLEELRTINGLTSDLLYAGRHLTISYVTAEEEQQSSLVQP